MVALLGRSRVTGLTLTSRLCVRGNRAYLAQAAIPSSATSAAQGEADGFLGSFVIEGGAER